MASRYGGEGTPVKEGRRVLLSHETGCPKQIVVAFSTPRRLTRAVDFRFPMIKLSSRLVALAVSFSLSAQGAGPAVMISVTPGTEPGRGRTVREVVASRRQVVDLLPLPSPGVVSTDLIAIEQRSQAVRLALARARKKESEALWDDCVREVAGAMSDALEVIATTGEFALLRDLHLQAGFCLSLADQASGARSHFRSAALLDETPPPSGLHREEAERVQVEARNELLARPRGKVRIVTEPPGARVLIDGREVPGVTPIEVEARLGDHFVTLRRFRYESNTEQRFLQQFGLVRVNLEPARRSTLGAQLLAVRQGQAPMPSHDEIFLAEAAWSRAEQVLNLAPERAGGGYRLSLRETANGKMLKSVALAGGADEAATRRAVCDLLGETCEAPRGIPWYVWPLAGAVIAGGVVTTALVLDANRDTRICPPSGCR
jgi:hypothetical protein